MGESTSSALAFFTWGVNVYMQGGAWSISLGQSALRSPGLLPGVPWRWVLEPEDAWGGGGGGSSHPAPPPLGSNPSCLFLELFLGQTAPVLLHGRF